MIETAIKEVAQKEDLTFEQARNVINEIMSGQTSAVQIASLLTALSVKKETIPEIAGAAQAMRDKALTISPSGDVLEIVGTGGDHSNSFNVSTTTALVVAAAGIPVAKHGNRAASSRSGAADVLEALGVKIDLEPEQNERLLAELNICFLFAQKYHQAMKYVAPVRKELGIRTIFNILGPLANPAGANLQLLGVYSPELVEPLARVLQQLGLKRALVVNGADGLDEVTLTGETKACELCNDEIKLYSIKPEDFGFERCNKSDLVGGTAKQNAEITRSILAGQKGPKLDTVLLNAGCAIHLAKPKLTIEQGIELARETILNKKAIAKLEQFIAASQAEVAR